MHDVAQDLADGLTEPPKFCKPINSIYSALLPVLNEPCVHEELWVVCRQIQHEKYVRHRLEENHLHWVCFVLSESPYDSNYVWDLHSKSHNFSSKRALLVNNLQLFNDSLVSCSSLSGHAGLSICHSRNEKQ